MMKILMFKKRVHCKFQMWNFRNIHNSHLNKTLKNRYNDEKMRDKYLDNIYNNEININTINQNIKHKKIDYLRQLIYDEADGNDYFLSDNILEEIQKKKKNNNVNMKNEEKKQDDNFKNANNNIDNENTKEEMCESKYKQAIRIYNLLKLNDKTNVFDEDVFMNIDSKMNHDLYEFSQKYILNKDIIEGTSTSSLGINKSGIIQNNDDNNNNINSNDNNNNNININSSSNNNKRNYYFESSEEMKRDDYNLQDNVQNDQTNNDINDDKNVNVNNSFNDNLINNISEECNYDKNKNCNNNFMNITNMNLPIFNPNSFCLAVENLTNEICEDLIFLFGDILEEKEIPKKGECDRLYKFVTSLSNFFCLEKNEEDVERWINDVYEKVKKNLPSNLSNLNNKYVEEWLKGHIKRVLYNQKYKNKTLYKEKYYNIGNDFKYDNLQINNDNIMEDMKIEFSTDKLTLYFKSIIEFFFGKKNINKDLEEQINLMCINLKKIGLDNWLQMDINDFEKYLLRNNNNNFIEITDNDKYVSYLMLKCASRNITDFYFYEEFSPFYLFHEQPKNSIEERINTIQQNKHISDEQLKNIIYNNNSSLTIINNNKNSNTYNDMDIDLFLQKEKNYNMNRSLITYTYNESTNSYNYKYKQIPNTIYDQNTNKYIREKDTIDPMLKLNEMRSSILEVKRMMSMTKDGRVYYIRIVIIIGNGKGVYGYGVGFGKNIKEARNSALLNSISNLDFIDFNYKNCILNFPVSGQEYSSHVKIIPRPLGKGLKINRKYLPLAYILGLDNVKISFSGSNKWMSRIKALKRCLNKIVSIKTLCKMTGKKYVCHFAPHYYTSHWPDYWFKNILNEYKYRIQKIQKKRSMVCRKNFRSNISKIPEEVVPDFTPYTWKTPIQKFVESQKLKKYVDNNIYRTNVF
ncbi:hypothetical protein PFTANZ_01808 [Plasmodium falciparum Tanzania (2000708)]|uniref:S5 DRBM domain-containing protein n=1 Tax=Plasmodium falciparum Tanzania (2000708) TaxID=1036725 RepID=A0A024WA83_PLAFA|nr:hypothetical protein PFTANZ_01808 [Plasmodium falciparum Tanzania (2000708)]